MYVDIDKLADLMSRNTLADCIQKGVLLPQAAQRLWINLPGLLSLSLDALAQITSSEILSQRHVVQEDLNVLNELLGHFGLFIRCPPVVLSPEQAQKVCEQVTCLLSPNDAPGDVAFDALERSLRAQSFLEGMAFAYAISDSQLIDLADLTQRRQRQA